MLNLSGTSITKLPEEIGDLTGLEELDISDTNIETLPDSINKLHKLTFLNLSGCKVIKALPLGLITMPREEELTIEIDTEDLKKFMLKVESDDIEIAVVEGDQYKIKTISKAKNLGGGAGAGAGSGGGGTETVLGVRGADGGDLPGKPAKKRVRTGRDRAVVAEEDEMVAAAAVSDPEAHLAAEMAGRSKSKDEGRSLPSR